MKRATDRSLRADGEASGQGADREILLDIVRRLDRIETGQIEFCRRLQDLSFSHHREIGPRPEDEDAVISALFQIVVRAEFNSLEVQAYGEKDPAFRALLHRANCHDPVAIGYLLRRAAAAGATVEGCQLTKIGRDSEGVIWQFVPDMTMTDDGNRHSPVA